MTSRKRARKIALSIFLLFLALSLLFVYLRYADLKKISLEKISEKASSVIGQRVYIENLSLSLLGTINLDRITIKNPDGFASGQLLRIKRLHLDIRPKELLKGNYSFRNITLDSPELTLMRDEKGRWNISDELMALFSGKSTTQYQLNEFRIDSGFFDINGDERYRVASINLRLENLSSAPSTRTEIKGTVVYAGNRVQMDGWVTLNDATKKFNLYISSKDVTLSPFRKTFDTYKINTEKTRMNADLRIAGETEKEFHITSSLQIKRVGVPLLNKEISDIRLRADMMFSLRDYSLVVYTTSLFVNGVSTATLKGMVTDLKKNPSYSADIKIDRFDLSKLNFMKDLKVKGILSSNNLRIKGNFESKVPELSGSFQMKEGGIESSHGIIEKVDADFILSLNKGISIKGEGLARVVKAGSFSPSKPLDVRLSATLDGTQERVDIISSFSLSSLEIKFKDEKSLSLDSGNVAIEGTMKGRDFSGKTSLEIKGIRLADRSIPWLKSSSTMDYQKGEIILNHA